MEKEIRIQLKRKFGDRVRFDRLERTVYSYDMAALPGMVERMVKALPEAVVQPTNLEEVVSLVSLARQYSLPIVPRGAGTSGYGGAVPTKGGIVVSFRRMNRVLSFDKEAGTVTVQPGVIYAQLEKALAPHGLMLRTYPTSAPGSTVGGWVAEGGSGIGGYEHGYAHESLVSVKAVNGQGEVEEFRGERLALISRAEGTTGLIVEVTLKTRPLEEERVVAADFEDLASLVRAVREAGRQGLPIWHVSFSTASFQAKKRAAAAEVAAAAAAAEAVGEGEAKAEATEAEAEAGDYTPQRHEVHTAMFVFPASRAGQVENGLLSMIKAAGGRRIPDNDAEHEWAERFYPMRFKRLGPSLIPSESVIPLDRVADIIEEGQKRLPGIAIEGTMVGRSEVTLLCFLLADQRTMAYTASFAKSLVMMDIALSKGGRAYSVGLYFQDDAPAAIGQKNLDAMAGYKQRTDPAGLLNPGKIFPGSAPGTLRAAMGMARQMAHSGKGLINIAESLLPKKVPTNRKNLPAPVVSAAYACARCGYCVPECTLMMGSGWESTSPRGKFIFIQEYLNGNLQLTQKQVHNFLMCTTCKRCNPVCQVNIPIQETWDLMRPVMIQRMKYGTYPAFEMMSSSMHLNMNIWAEYKKDRDAWVPDDVKENIVPQSEVGYWAGCTASYVEKDIAVNATRILKDGGVQFAYLGKDEACCGMPMAMAGLEPEFLMAVKNNLEQIRARGIKKLVISCPGCWTGFHHYYPAAAKKLGIPMDFEIQHITEATEELMNAGKLQFKERQDPDRKVTVTWHDSCHIGRHGGIYEPPRNVLKALPGVEYVDCAHNRDDGYCCGSVLTRISDTKISDNVAALRLQEAKDAGAEMMAATCPCCEVQLRVGGRSSGVEVPVLDFSDLVVKALGYASEDTTEHVHKAWAVFDKAIKAMTPNGIVDMMSRMLPEIVDSMPSVMAGMMKGIGRLPSGVKDPTFASMEKMMPTLMPMLFGGMMPKLMPKANQLMLEMIPDMPQTMKDQLPEMLPYIMARIMPTMMAEVATKLAPKITVHLGKTDKGQTGSGRNDEDEDLVAGGEN